MYNTRNHGYWKKKGVKYIKPLPLFGNILDNFKMSLHEVEQQRYQKYGTIFGHYEGNNPVLTVAEPELLRSILLKDFFSFSGRRPIPTTNKLLACNIALLEGEEWKRVRSIISPTFSTGKLKRLLSIFKDCAQTLVQNFQNAAEQKKSFEVKRLFGTYTMDVIASAAFSVKIDSHNDPDNKFVRYSRSMFGESGVNWRFVIFFFAPKLAQKLGLAIFNVDALEFFKKATLHVIEQRKKSGQKRNDFLQLMLDATQEGEGQEEEEKEGPEDIASNYAEDASAHQVFKEVRNKHLSTDEMIAQCVLFFIAGYESTAATLGFVTYLLALNPEIQSKLREEVDDTLKENDGDLSYDSLQSMKYLDNVISEAMRIFPPAVRLERIADSDYVLGDTGICIPKGMLVNIPSYAMHMDPKHFPDPEKFDPDRFLPGERALRSPYVYLPFGAGPRNCVGMRFALMEIKVCLVYVVAHFVVKRSPQTKVPLEFVQGQRFLQAKEIILDLEKRSHSNLK